MTWYDVLKEVRKISKTGAEITSATISKASGLEVKVASAWLSNFYHWGYVLPIGKKVGVGRPTKIYKLTKWGVEFRPKAAITRIAAPLRKAANPKEES